MQIRDLVQPVVNKLRQRTDMQSFLPYYIAMAIIELTQNYEFEDLKTTGPLTNFIVNQAKYPLKGYDKAGIQGNPFILPDDQTATFITAFFVYFDTNGIITPGQSTGKEMDKRDFRVVEPMSKITGIPSVYCQQGTYRNNGYLLVGQMPDFPYPCQMSYQRQHPFNIPMAQVIQACGNSDLANKLGASTVFMPDDWTDIIVYFSAEKVCDDVGMSEIGKEYHQKLFGYKDKRGNEMPGLVTVKKTEQERNTSFNSRALRPVVRRYT